MTADKITAIKKALEELREKIGHAYDSGYNRLGQLSDWCADLDAMRPTLESLQRENEAMKKDRYDLAYAITGGEDAPGLLDSVPTSELVEIARNTHRTHSADIDRAMLAEAEVKRLREDNDRLAKEAGYIGAALSSTGDTHGN